MVVFSSTKDFQYFSADCYTLHKNRLMSFCYKSLNVPSSSVSLGLIEYNDYTRQAAGNLPAISGAWCCRGGWWVMVLLRSRQKQRPPPSSIVWNVNMSCFAACFLSNWKKSEGQFSYKVKFTAGKVRAFWLIQPFLNRVHSSKICFSMHMLSDPALRLLKYIIT